MRWETINLGELMPMNKIGIDTNILIYALDKESDFYQLALFFLNSLQGLGVVCWQNLTEFYAIVTDSRRIRNNLTPQIAIREIETLINKYSLTVIGPNIKTKEIGFRLLRTKDVSGQLVHDVFLAATLLSNGINTLITENTKDFLHIQSLKTRTLKD